MRYYRNTVAEWIAALQQMEKAGLGDERVALAIWTKKDVEEQLRMHGYRLEMSDEEWADYANNTEDTWSAFDEDDLSYTVEKFGLAYEGREEK